MALRRSRALKCALSVPYACRISPATGLDSRCAATFWSPSRRSVSFVIPTAKRRTGVPRVDQLSPVPRMDNVIMQRRIMRRGSQSNTRLADAVMLGYFSVVGSLGGWDMIT